MKNQFGEQVAIRSFSKTFIIYLAFALFLTGVQLVIEYRLEEERLIHSIQGINQIFNQILTEALWEYDFDLVKEHMKGIANAAEIAKVALYDLESDQSFTFQKGEIFSHAGKLLFEGGNTKLIFPLKHLNGGMLGELFLFYEQSIILSRILESAYLILANAILKSFLLWLIFYFVSKKMITKPIETIRQNLKESLLQEDKEAISREDHLRFDFEKMKTEISFVTEQLKQERRKQREEEESLKNDTLLFLKQGANRNKESPAHEESILQVGTESLNVHQIAWISIKEHYLTIRHYTQEGWKDSDTFGSLKAIEDSSSRMIRINRATLINPEKILGKESKKDRLYLLMDDGKKSEFIISKAKEKEIAILIQILKK